MRVYGIYHPGRISLLKGKVKIMKTLLFVGIVVLLLVPPATAQVSFIYGPDGATTVIQGVGGATFVFPPLDAPVPVIIPAPLPEDDYLRVPPVKPSRFLLPRHR